MTRSGFKTAQRRINLTKKENNNKEYRDKMPGKVYAFSNGLSFDYVLRTKHNICLPGEHTDEENEIIREEADIFYRRRLYFESCDATHSIHSKKLSKDRANDRREKLN